MKAYTPKQPWIKIAALLLTLAGESAAMAQPQSARDSMTFSLRIDMLKHRFQIAGDLYKAAKFRLLVPAPEKADSLMTYCITEYKSIYAMLREKSAGYFSDSFYKEVIPAVQYARYAGWVGLLMEHREQLHPAPAIHDPKHHQEETEHHHSSTHE